MRNQRIGLPAEFGNQRICLAAEYGKTTNTTFTTRDKIPAELGKTTNTTFTTSNNAFDKPCAEPSSLGLCHGEKGYHEMEPTRFCVYYNPAAR